MKRKGIECPRCHENFKTRQGLGNHLRYCKTVRERPAAVQTSQRAPAPELLPALKNIPIIREKQWDPAWSFEEKRRHILESLPCTWGIRKGPKGWKPVPMLGTKMTYSEAVAAADRFEFVRRMTPHPS